MVAVLGTTPHAQDHFRATPGSPAAARLQKALLGLPEHGYFRALLETHETIECNRFGGPCAGLLESCG